MNKIKRVFRLETWRKFGSAAWKIAKKIIWWIAVMQFAGNAIVFMVTDIMWIAGKIEYIPGYMKVEEYCTAAAFIVIFIAEKQQERSKIETAKIMEKVKINDRNWKMRFTAEMMKGIQFFRSEGNLSTMQEAKFRQIVSYSIGKMEEEMKEEK